jgi:hypothetical protein
MNAIRTIPAIVGAAKWLWWANPPAAIAVGVVLTVGVVCISKDTYNATKKRK